MRLERNVLPLSITRLKDSAAMIEALRLRSETEIKNPLNFNIRVLTAGSVTILVSVSVFVC